MGEVKSPQPTRRSLRRFALPLAWIALIAGHLAATAYFAPPRLMLSRSAVSGQELDAHAGETFRVVEALEKGGRTWAYDPQLLAGCPRGLLFDAGDKAWELWTLSLKRLGVPRGTAFNSFILAVHLLVPIILFIAGGLYRLGRVARFSLVALGALVWWFDSYVHWAWWSGAVTWAFAGVLCLLPLGLLHRFLEDRRLAYAAALAPVLGIVLLVHPFAFFGLAVPMTALYARRLRDLGARHHAAVAGVVLIAIAVNAFWLRADLRFWRYLVGTSGVGTGTLFNLATDYAGIVADRADSGSAGMRSGFRFLALALAIVTLFYWRKERDGRFLPFAVALGWLAALAYLAGYFAPLGQIQPYRFAGPLAFFACIPAAHLVERLGAVGAIRGLPIRVYAVFAITALVALPRLARDVIFFLPPLVPHVEELADEKPRIADPVGFSSIGYPSHPSFRYAKVSRERAAVIDWVSRRAKDGPSGRFLVEDWGLGELLAVRTRAEILGGHRLRNLAHTAADFFRFYPRDPLPDGALEAFMRRYAVRYVITSLTHARFVESRSALRKIEDLKPYMIFEARREPSLFAEGAGEVKTSLNRLEVRGTQPGEDLVLRYHWIETFRCTPSCAIRREPVEGDPVGFIRVSAGHPADFAIVNGY